MTDRRLLLRLAAYARPHWKAAAISVMAMLLTAGLEPALPALMKPLIDESLIARDAESLWQIPVLIALVFAARGLADYLSNVSSQTLAQRTVTDLRATVFAHQMALSIPRHQAEPPGRMLSRITFDTGLVASAVATAWLIVIRDTLMLIGLLGYMFYIAWELTLLMLVIAPVLAGIIQLTSRKLRGASTNVQGLVGRFSGLIQESFQGLSEIKIFGAYSAQKKRFDEVNADLCNEQLRAIRIQALNVPMVQVLAASAVAGVIYIASRMSQADALSPGTFVSFVTAMSLVFEPVRRLTNVNATLQQCLAACDSIFALLDEPAELRTNTPSAPRTELPPTPQSPMRFRGDIVFDRVGYTYAGQPRPALQGFDLHVAAGETVALVGPSGSGKSTALFLLAGFDRPQEGSIRIDGCPMEDIPLESLRGNLALVSQRVMLFDLSVRENLTLGRPHTEAEVWRALRAAHAESFVRALPEGLETRLGALGDRLSGGQRQRLAIARAFLKDAPILLLDEATSALDAESEKAVLEGLAELMKGRTVLLVSHAPERLLGIDRVIDFAECRA